MSQTFQILQLKFLSLQTTSHFRLRANQLKQVNQPQTVGPIIKEHKMRALRISLRKHWCYSVQKLCEEHIGPTNSAQQINTPIQNQKLFSVQRTEDSEKNARFTRLFLVSSRVLIPNDNDAFNVKEPGKKHIVKKAGASKISKNDLPKPKSTSAYNEKQIAVFSGIQKIAWQNSLEEASDKLCSYSAHFTLVVPTILLSNLYLLHIDRVVDIENNTDLDSHWSIITQKLIIQLNHKTYLIIRQYILLIFSILENFFLHAESLFHYRNRFISYFLNFNRPLLPAGRLHFFVYGPKIFFTSL